MTNKKMIILRDDIKAFATEKEYIVKEEVFEAIKTILEYPMALEKELKNTLKVWQAQIDEGIYKFVEPKDRDEKEVE